MKARPFRTGAKAPARHAKRPGRGARLSFRVAQGPTPPMLALPSPRAALPARSYLCFLSVKDLRRKDLGRVAPLHRFFSRGPFPHLCRQGFPTATLRVSPIFIRCAACQTGDTPPRATPLTAIPPVSADDGLFEPDQDHSSSRNPTPPDARPSHPRGAALNGRDLSFSFSAKCLRRKDLGRIASYLIDEERMTEEKNRAKYFLLNRRT